LPAVPIEFDILIVPGCELFFLFRCPNLHWHIMLQ
jgi:hypothetical protein